MKLAEYRRKRDHQSTPEPAGKEPLPSAGPTRAGVYVVHLHDATRRHWDLRIEAAGVLVSFAVPRGPSLDPAERRLAVRTEDHPLEYLEFEAVIPEKSYGGGAMILWDRGRIEYLEGPVEQGLDRGKLDFVLDGLKLRGRFALVRMKGSGHGGGHARSSGKENEWLLLKKADAFASPGGARDPVRDAPRSVLSGLTVEELGSAPGIAAALEARAAALGAPVTMGGPRPPQTPRMGFGHDGEGRITVAEPMPCALEGAPEAGPEWLYELKLDGVRALCIKDERGTRIIGRKLHDVTTTYPEIARAVAALPPARVVLDGEIVAQGSDGRPSFHRLAKRIHLQDPHDIRRARQEIPVTFVAFDLPALGARDLSPLPLTARKELLHALLPAAGVLRALDHVEDDARPLLAFCAQHDLEGIVAKRKTSPYRTGPRRSGDWVKMKRTRDDDFVVVGYTRGEGARERMGALDVASWAGEALVNRGKVGSGLDDEAIDVLLAKLGPLATETCAGTGELAPAPRGRTLVRPEVVVRVRYDGFSEDGAQVLHGVFAGVREDVAPRECTAGPRGVTRDGDSARAPARARNPDEIGLGLGLGLGSGVSEAERERERDREGKVAITNPRKVLWPGEGITKADLVGYYQAIAPAMLTYLRDRPVMMVRYPDGILGKSFYQWNVPLGTPAWMRTHRLVGEDGASEEVFVIDDARALAHVANLAAIPLHLLAARVASPEDCDFLNLDFDVKGASLREGVTLAQTLRGILDAIGMPGYPKTSGQSGLHVFVPLGPGVSYVTARALADLLGRLLCDAHPDLATMERRIEKRGPRVYVDTGQTGPSRTIVAPWAVRAKPGAPVSTPLAWDEVAPGLDPGAFTIRTAPARFEAMGDPMAGLLAARPNVGEAVAKLEERVRGRR